MAAVLPARSDGDVARAATGASGNRIPGGTTDQADAGAVPADSLAAGTGGAALDPLRPADVSRAEHWAALHTHSRREKRVSRACDYLGVRRYLPVYEHQTGATRRRTYVLPLFPGYVFACLDHDSRLDILRTGAVVRVLWPTREDVLLHELRQIRAALEASVDLVVGPAVARGDLVRVVCGPLAGVEGLVSRRLRRRRRERLVLNVSMLGSCVATEIDLRHVQPVRRLGRRRQQGPAENVAC